MWASVKRPYTSGSARNKPFVKSHLIDGKMATFGRQKLLRGFVSNLFFLRDFISTLYEFFSAENIGAYNVHLSGGAQVLEKLYPIIEVACNQRISIILLLVVHK